MRRWCLVFWILFLSAVPAFAQTDTPTPIPPTPTVLIPSGQIGDAISNGESELSSLGSISAPNGVPLVPNENGARLFGYIKWLVSPPTADELAGPFSPIVTELGILIFLEVAMLAVYIIVYIVVYAVRWAIWIFRLILEIVQAAASIVGGGISFLLGFIGL